MQDVRPMAAVAYLNMLPFFAGDPSLKLYSSPSELNADLAAGRLLAGCSSVLAGLKSKLRPTTPLCGVAAESLVESVFIEAILTSDQDGARWDRIRERNQRSLDGDGPERLMEGLARLSPDGASTVTLLTSGASAQSHWIVTTLLQALGLRVETLQVGADVERAPPDVLAQMCQSLSRPGLTCLLTIGDPALERRLLYPEEPLMRRFDVAELWRESTATPCLFALWFRAASREDRDSSSAKGAPSPQILSALEQWEGLDDRAKVQAAKDFLDRTGKQALIGLLGSDGILNYLGHLNYKLDEKPYQDSLSLMEQLLEVQTTFRARKFVSSSRSTVSRMRFL